MQFIGVDLGTTNIKAAVYGPDFTQLACKSIPVSYVREGGVVEFDAEQYVEQLLDLLRQLCEEPQVSRDAVAEIAFTGQAETLVVLDGQGRPLMRAISWMDERSQEECRIAAEVFPAAEFERITGQQAMLPTWPATKILWLRRNRPELYGRAAAYLLLKDYVVYRLTGVMQAERSIATFSAYFDIYEGVYWQAMLDFLGLRPEQLPPLVEPCTVAGPLTGPCAQRLGLPTSVLVNHGTLDHFAGMIGTGNVAPGTMNLSTGTVMALATMAREPVTDRNCGVAMHYGFEPRTHVMLAVAESGGVSLEWFRKTCMAQVDYGQLNRVRADRLRPGSILVLPYRVGTNAPEFDREASGVFWGLRAEHDAYDMAAAVMEGVAYLLRKNCQVMADRGAEITRIIATGGGSNSDIWCQMQADITGCPVCRPAEREAACLGAAMIGAVSCGAFPSYEAAAARAVVLVRLFLQ